MWRPNNKRRNGALTSVLAWSQTQVKLVRTDVKVNEARALLEACDVPRELCFVGGSSHFDNRDSHLTVERYSTERQAWESVCPTKQREVHAGARLGHELYLAGGVYSHLTLVECFDLDTRQWRGIAPLKTGRAHCAVATLNGRLYVLGGQTSNYARLSSVECYTPDTNRWHDAPPMSIERAACAAGVLEGQLYVVGGHDDRGRPLASVERFEPQTQTWTSVAPLNTARCGHRLAVLEGKLYVVGGVCLKRGVQKTLSSVECYNPLENKWTFVAAMSRPRELHGVAALEGKLYVAGGVHGTSKLATVECYNPHTNEWEPVPNLTSPRFSGVLVAV